MCGVWWLQYLLDSEDGNLGKRKVYPDDRDWDGEWDGIHE